MDKFRVFVEMLMRDASLKQRFPCIMRISIFGAFSAGKKCALYTGKYGSLMVTLQLYKQNLDSFLDRNSSEQPDLEQIWLW